MRKLFAFFILLILWAGLYLLLTSQEPSSALSWPEVNAHPSAKALPEPWTGNSSYGNSSYGSSPRVTIRAAVAQINVAAQTGICQGIYVVERGDTLGKIASRCGFAISDLMISNPDLGDPDRIYVGQQLALLNSEAGEAQVVSDLASDGISAGALLTVRGEGFPVGVKVRVGLGLSQEGYRVVSEVQADDHGVINTQINIPDNAASGESIFVLLTSQGVPSVQAVSESFKIYP